MSHLSEGELSIQCSSYSKVMPGSPDSNFALDGKETSISLSLLFNCDFVMLLIYHRGDLVDRIPLDMGKVVITATQNSLHVTDEKNEYNILLQRNADPTVLLDKIHNLRSGLGTIMLCDIYTIIYIFITYYRLPKCKILCHQSWRDSFIRTYINNRLDQVESEPATANTEVSASGDTIDLNLVEDVERILQEFLPTGFSNN